MIIHIYIKWLGAIMKAEGRSVLEFIGGLDKVFIIPPFQRNYDWKIEHCKELFDDIEKTYRDKKSHYLGNIIYYVGKNTGASYSENILIDGQQRITSILLLLCAIRDKSFLSAEDEIAKSIDRKYLKNDTADSKYRVRLKQTVYNAESFANIVERCEISNQENNIYWNYEYFLQRVEASEVSLKNLFETITSLEIVEINLQIDDDLRAIQTVFEKINSTGKRLTPADLIRNYLLFSNSYKEQEKLYTNYWVKIEQCVEDNISRFAHTYLVMKSFNEVPEKEIYQDFKKFFDGKNHEEILKEMLDFSGFYAWIAFENCPNEKINKAIKILNCLKSEDLYPLYLYLFHVHYVKNPEELEKILGLLGDFMLRYRIVAPSRGGGALRTLIYQILKAFAVGEVQVSYDAIFFELSNSRTTSGRFPDDEEFKEALMKHVSIDYARIVLLKIEEKNSKNISVPWDKVTVEHLMPKKLTSGWEKALGGANEADRIYPKYLNCIGNLAPVSQGYNSRMSNNVWKQKLLSLGNVQFNITRELKEYLEWNEESMQKRNKDIARKACSVITSPQDRKRKIQQNIFTDEDNNSLYSISDLEISFVNRKPKYFLFEENQFSVKSWRELLLTVCEIFYAENENNFGCIVDENKIHRTTKAPIISKEKKMLRVPLKVEYTNYFVEGNLSSLDIRRVVLKLAELYDVVDKFKICVPNDD